MVQFMPMNPDDDAAVAEIANNRAFAAAFRHITQGYLAAHASAQVRKLVANEARFHIAHFAICLHAEHVCGLSPVGLTAARLLERCVARGIISRGRLDAMVLTLRQAGWLMDAPQGDDRRMKLLRPSPVMEQNFRARIAFHLEALDMLGSGQAFLEAFRQQPRFFWALEAERGRLLAGLPSLSTRIPELNAVSEREGAYTALVWLMHDADMLNGQPDALPSPGLVPFTLAGAAARQGIARSQMGRILDDLTVAGLVTRLPDAERMLRIEPLAVRMMTRWYATRLPRFALFAARGAALLAALDERRGAA